MLLVLRILLAHSEGDMKLRQKIFCFSSFEWHFFPLLPPKHYGTK